MPGQPPRRRGRQGFTAVFQQMAGSCSWSVVSETWGLSADPASEWAVPASVCV